MAWLQGLANKTEDLLDKIDKSANSLFNENVTPDSGRYTEIPINEDLDETRENQITECMEPQFFEDDSAKDSSSQEVTSFEWYNTEIDIIQSNYESKMVDLEQQNDNLSRRFLNLQHSFSEISNENENLKNQLREAKECVLSVENEMEDYKKRAQKALRDKDNFVVQETPNVINQNLQKKLKYFEELNNILSQKIQSVTHNFNNLQNEYKALQKTNDISLQTLQSNLEAERNVRISIENENDARNNEIKALVSELNNRIKLYEDNNKEYIILKEIMSKPEDKFDLTLRVQSLTDALIAKQSTLETICTEKNVLTLQLEKIRNKYDEVLKENQNRGVKNAELTKKSKSRGSDSLSTRCCIYFSRSKFSRFTILAYFSLLHLWVLIILCYYVPGK